ncbi:hypothetical protein CEXT_85781 [Caerostris extrusa]|uniref:Uncharacterized protein n=1 Tax=Caerostris extrusa TaxID=172846 RepID=A0AAV4R0R6_CAEEX|nr:hypothetical protein CEXT_85781 [Caerostris extrusa]
MGLVSYCERLKELGNGWEKSRWNGRLGLSYLNQVLGCVPYWENVKGTWKCMGKKVDEIEGWLEVLLFLLMILGKDLTQTALLDQIS